MIDNFIKIYKLKVGLKFKTKEELKFKTKNKSEGCV
jgi:hypothetical protein